MNRMKHLLEALDQRLLGLEEAKFNTIYQQYSGIEHLVLVLVNADTRKICFLISMK